MIIKESQLRKKIRKTIKEFWLRAMRNKKSTSRGDFEDGGGPAGGEFDPLYGDPYDDGMGELGEADENEEEE